MYLCTWDVFGSLSHPSKSHRPMVKKWLLNPFDISFGLVIVNLFTSISDVTGVFSDFRDVNSLISAKSFEKHPCTL